MRSRYALFMAEARTKWEEDNESSLNLWAIFAAVVLILFVVGLAVLFALT
ncbi:MAG TPA: hypothetical protein VK273_01625 [Gaiellaceae bacterium]|nr:hypothetical protein [Gaiellaceae bacterium]